MTIALDDLTQLHDLLADFGGFDAYRLGGYVIALTALALGLAAVKLTGRAAAWSARAAWAVVRAGWRRLVRPAPHRPLVAALLKRMEGREYAWVDGTSLLRWPGLAVTMEANDAWVRGVKVGDLNVSDDLTRAEKKAVSLAARKAIAAYRVRERAAREQLATEALKPVPSTWVVRDAAGGECGHVETV